MKNNSLLRTRTFIIAYAITIILGYVFGRSQVNSHPTPSAPQAGRDCGPNAAVRRYWNEIIRCDFSAAYDGLCEHTRSAMPRSVFIRRQWENRRRFVVLRSVLEVRTLDKNDREAMVLYRSVGDITSAEAKILIHAGFRSARKGRWVFESRRLVRFEQGRWLLCPLVHNGVPLRSKSG